MTASTRRTNVRRAVLALLVLAAILGTAPADAGKVTKKKSTSAPRRPNQAELARRLRADRAERARVAARRANVASKVRALKVTTNQAEQALSTLNRNVKVQTAVVQDARRDADQATREARDAHARETAVENNIRNLQASQAKAAVNAYATRTEDDVSFEASADGVLSAGSRQVYADIAGRHGADVLDRLRALNEDLTIARAAADRAEKQARAKRSAYEKRLSNLRSARSQQSRLAVDSEAKLEAALAEAAAVSAIDKGLAARITANNASLAREIAAANARLERSRPSAGGGSTASVRVGNVAVGSTNGIVVASSLRGDLARMIAAAAADGVTLRGSGYRSPQMQVVLRRAHCGSSTFAIYSMRASACRPPTARPGQSMHERGLAVDFADGGGSLRRSSPGYRWLRANAHRFGFKNLPSEPWHWSINGR